MLTRREFSGLLTAAAASPWSNAAASALADSHASARSMEVEALRKFAEQTHPEGARAASDLHWSAQASTLAATAAAMSESRYVVELLSLLSYFRDGHTTLFVASCNRGAWALRFPIAREVFYDGVYITSAKDEALPLLGARIERVAGVPVQRLLQRFADVFPSSNIAGAHRWGALALSSPGFLHGLGLVTGSEDAPLLFEGRLANGKPVAANLVPRADGTAGRQPLPRKLSPLELHSESENYGKQTSPGETGRNFVWLRNDHNAIYLSYDRMSEDDFGKPFAVFQSEIKAAMAHDDAKKIVIDLRRNGGGDNTLSEPFRHMLARSRFNRPGSLYVLIAPHTFSAAQNLAARLERETFALFVGEPASQCPNFYGDAQPFKTPASDLPIQVSTVRWMDSSPFDHREWIMPDHLVPSTFADYLEGRDPAFDFALTDTYEAAIDDNALTAPWERKSQTQTWTPFWAVKPPADK
jgi:hypothetical protein